MSLLNNGKVGEMKTAEGVDIVVQILKEAGWVDELIDGRARAFCGVGLIFVHTGSTDGTLERLQARKVETIRHSRNEGYGKSLRDGIAGGKGSAVVTIDADLEYPPESIPALLDALQSNPVVYGSRFRGGRRPTMGAVRRFGNRPLTGLFNLIFLPPLTYPYTQLPPFRPQ